MSTVHAVFRATAGRTPAADFLCVEPLTATTYGMAAGTVSWQEAAGRIDRLCVAYAAAGVGHGHRAGLMLENRPAFLFHWLALNALGASVVPLHAELGKAELEYLIGHSGLRLAVTLPGRVADVHAAAARAGVSLAAVPLCETGFAPPPVREAPPRAHEPIGADSECALLYTSGTTGRPKGCRLSNAYFLRAGEWYATLGGLATVRRDAERVLTPLPLHHVNAMAFSTMVVLTAGGCLVQLDRFHPSHWWRTVRETGATIVHYLGVMPAMLLGAEPSPTDTDHAVRWGFGAGVDRRHHAAFESRFGFPLIEAWAMTETGAAACIMANVEPRQVGTGCFGRPEAFVDIRLVDDQGAEVPDDVPGELLVRSAGPDPRRHFFSGYLKDEAATEAAWAGGWFHTGDMVRRDAGGNLAFVDRKKNVIRRSGENISAVEVESVLNQHPAVRASAVAATPDALRGDEVLACIVLRDPVPEDARPALAESIVRHALDQLAYFKAPGYVAFVDALPLTASQKIQRAELRDRARALPADPACVDTRALKKRQGVMCSRRASYEGVAVAVPVTVPYERYSTHGAHWFLGRAVEALVRESGVAKDEIDGLCVSSFSLAPDTAVGVTQHLGLSPRWLDHLPTGGASGVMALRRAARAVQAGDADIVACVGADTNHVDSFRQTLGSFSTFARDATYPYGSGGPNSVFAFITAHYMRTFGATREDFGRIAVAQRDNALRNPNALFKKPLALDEYLAAKPIADPIHLFDCVMPCAGAEAFLVMAEARARDLGLPHALVLGGIERHNAFADDPVMVRGGWAVDRDDLYAQAGVGPGDIDFVQTYDDYPVIVMMQFEDLGFCEKGEAPDFVRRHTLTHDGTFPNNTGGGQLSCGQAGAAAGLLGMNEAIRQLTHRAGDRAVPGARLGLVAGFGMVTYDRCLCTGAFVLGRSDR